MLHNLVTLQAEGASSGMMNMLMIVALIVVFYFFMIRPQQKKQKEIRKFRQGLQKGDKVISAGGIYGKIIDMKENYVLLEIDKGVNIRIDKGSVYPSAVDIEQTGENPKEKN